MKTRTGPVIAAVAFLFVGAIAASAQPTTPQPHQTTPAPEREAMPGGMMSGGGGMSGGGMMSGGGGMCEMMMGAMGRGPADAARMMQMRGEMMKAMGEIMMKHGKMMETPAPAR